MRNFAGISIGAFCSLIIQVDGSKAWEATYSSRVSGPLRTLTRDANGLPLTIPNNPGDDKKQLENMLELSPLTPVTRKYPAGEGVSIGEGWDLYLGRKTNSRCINFSIDENKSQTADLTLTQATDEETRDVTLNWNFETGGGGGYDPYTGKGKTTAAGNSFDHFYSKDLLLVMHAAVDTDVRFAVPPPPVVDDKGVTSSSGSIKLLPDMQNRRDTKFEEFRKDCGDGFVSSIVSGADLYSLFTFRSVDQATRSELNGTMETSGTYGAFNFFVSGGMKKIVDNHSAPGAVSIELIQNGEQIRSLPFDLPTLQSKLQNLPAEAWDAPKPSYIIIKPYSELPDIKSDEHNKYTQTLQAVVR